MHLHLLPGTDSQTLCTNTALTDIRYATTGATGATFTGLPAGVTGSWLANEVIITGSPSIDGAFNYIVTLTGGCGTITANGTITVNLTPVPAFTAEAGPSVCASTDVTYSTQPGQTNYVWILPGVSGTDYTVTAGGTSTDNSITLQWLTPGSKTVGINYTSSGICTAAVPTLSSATLVTASPTTANAGPDQDGASICGLTTTTLAANIPAEGTGLWSIVSGAGGTLTYA